MENNIKYIRIVVCFIVVVGLFIACSNKKNTAINRLYHDVNTRYNVHFNANEAYQETLKSKQQRIESTSNFSDLLYLYPLRLDTTNAQYKGQFTKTIDKTSKAIKLHSISRKPLIDRSRMQDEKYKNWIRSKEFNPFLVNTWMLLADAQLEEEDYLQAIATSIYITKIYENNPAVVALAKLNIVRAYSEMGWIYEAENQLRKLEQDKLITPDNEDIYNSLKANLLIRKENYQESITYLKRAIETEKNGTEKRRKRYLLAQLYEQMGEKQQALESYNKIKGLTLPFIYELNVGLKKIELTDLSVKEKVKQLDKFGKKARFKESQYKIYDIIGDVYLADSDTVNAVKSFEKSLQLFDKTNVEKAIVDLKLGEILYSQEKYVQAQPLYAEALSIIKKDFKNYTEIAFRSEVLDELAIYSKTIHEQDSLLHLALLPEDERIQLIEDHIQELKDEEKRKADEEKRKQQQMEADIDKIDNAWQNPDLVAAVVDKYKTDKEVKYDFYFYNPTTVSQGKTTFQSIWGKRVLEDNWRNSDKSLTFGIDDMEEDNENDADSEEDKKEDGDKVDLTKDIYSVDYYLQQLPLTEEAQDKANDMIDDAMFNLALVYRYLLDHSGLTIETFLDELKRYPDTPHKEEIYYQLFLVFLQNDDIEQYRYYRDLILAEYPKSKYATPLSEQDFAWNFKYINKMQEEMYEKAYNAYLAGDVSTVRSNYETLQTKYPFASLMGKFAFLDALTYAQTRDIIKLEEKLNKLVATYPKEDFIPLAQGILKNIKNGMVLLSDGAIIQSINWQDAYQSKLAQALAKDSVDVFASAPNEPYVLVLNFAENTIDRNDLLYDVADFNFSNFIVKTYDLAFLNDSLSSSLVISTFDDSQDLQSYLQTLHEDKKLDYLKKWRGKIIPVAMTQKVYKSVLPLSGMQAYISYYEKNLSQQYPVLQANTSLSLEDYNKLELIANKVPDIRKDSLNEAGIQNVYIDDLPTVAPKDPNQAVQKTPDNELDLSNAVGKDVMDVLQKADDINKKVDDLLDDISQNPLEGIKNIFKKNEIEENLSKEEKAELKKWKKEQAKIEKQKQDSIVRVEQLRVDSIDQVEQTRIDSIKYIEQQKIDTEKLRKQTQLDNIKEAEQKRKDKARELDKLRKQKMDERKQKQTEMEQRRKQKMKEQDARRKEIQREREQKMKERR